MPKLNEHIVLNTLLLTFVLLLASNFSTARGIEEGDSIVFGADKDVQLKEIEEIAEAKADSAIQVFTVPHELADSLLEFILTSQIKYRTIGQFKTEEGKNWFTDGWRKTKELNNTLKLAGRLRIDYELATSNETKDSIAGHLLDLEMNTIQLKKLSDENYMNARDAEMNFWKSASESEVLQLIAENDSITRANLPKKDVVVFNETEKTKLNDEEQLEVVTDSIALLSPENNNTGSEGYQVIYKVQIGAFSSKLPDYIDRLYKKLSVLRRIDTYTTEKGVVVYTIGELTNLEDAVRLQNQIRLEGVKDAFVVAFNNGKRISLNEAQEITRP